MTDKKNKATANFFGVLYQKLFLINDTPQKIALGVGLGIFSGILPGTGPLAALFLAFILRANRAAALLGSALTNTWLSFVTFILALKTGSILLKVNWTDIRADWNLFVTNFSWKALFKLSALKLVFPVLLGYFIIALACGLTAYLITLAAILFFKKRKSG